MNGEVIQLLKIKRENISNVPAVNQVTRNASRIQTETWVLLTKELCTVSRNRKGDKQQFDSREEELNDYLPGSHWQAASQNILCSFYLKIPKLFKLLKLLQTIGCAAHRHWKVKQLAEGYASTLCTHQQNRTCLCGSFFSDLFFLWHHEYLLSSRRLISRLSSRRLFILGCHLIRGQYWFYPD